MQLMQLKMRDINYVASPTAARFHHSPKVVRGFLGPVGNGKSVACIMEGLMVSQDQWPNSEGIRKSRGVIVRNTSPELRTTTLNTWKQWIPESIAPIKMNPVIICNFQQLLGDGTKMEMEVYFLAMDVDKDVKKLESLETTWIFLNEARHLPYSVVKASRERIGRYPGTIDGYDDVYENGELIYKAPRDINGVLQPCKRKALVMDTNPPEDDHWWFKLAETGYYGKPKDKVKARQETARIFDFFRGPAPLLVKDGEYIPNPKAENIQHLPGGYQYYLDMIAGNTEDHINVMVLGNYGFIVEGRPVYPAYNDRVHCPEEPVRAIKGLELGLGWDFGLTPACIIGQQTPEGQLRIVAELVTEDMDVRTFARDVVKPFLQRYFSDFTIGFSLGDPAGNNRGEGEGKASISILNDEYEVYDQLGNLDTLDMGFVTEPAPTNDPRLRVEAVVRNLTRLTMAGEPGLVVDPRCRYLRRGMAGGYKFRRMQIVGEERYSDAPEKNIYSHVCEALQYALCGAGEVREALGRKPLSRLNYSRIDRGVV